MADMNDSQAQADALDTPVHLADAYRVVTFSSGPRVRRDWIRCETVPSDVRSWSEVWSLARTVRAIVFRMTCQRESDGIGAGGCHLPARRYYRRVLTAETVS